MNFDLNFYKGKKVFVTGHTGFKGSWLCKILANAGAIVTGYSLNPPTSPSLFEIANIEQDIHSVKVISNLGYMYKATKTAAHWIGKAKCGTYGIRFFWPLINTYGEEERSARLVNTIIRKVLHGESPDLSAGNQYYDFVHVSDVARALILIAEKGVDGTNYTIGSGDAKPLKEFLKIVGQVANDLHGGEPVELGFGKIKY